MRVQAGSDKSQGPGPGTSIGQGSGSEYNATMILKKLNDLAGVAENTDFRNSVTGFKTVLEQQLQTTSPKPPNLSITLEALKLWLEIQDTYGVQVRTLTM